MGLDFEVKKPIIGVIHLNPLPGSPRFRSLEKVIETAKHDAEKLNMAGIDGLIVENYGDIPFKKEIDELTVSAMTELISEIKSGIDKPIGINVLRNDWRSALSISKVLELDFIRVNCYCGVTLTDQGMIEGEAGKIQRFKENFDIEAKVMADIQVKHAKKLYPTDLLTEAKEASERGLADALIVSGERTGEKPQVKEIKRVKEKTKVPVIVGSGLDKSNYQKLLSASDGAIIGTHFKEDGITSNPVCLEKVESFMRKADELRQR